MGVCIYMGFFLDIKDGILVHDGIAFRFQSGTVESCGEALVFQIY